MRKAYSKRRRLRLCAVVETGESEDVGTRVRLHCDGTIQAVAELRYGVVVHMRENSVKYEQNS